MNSDQLQAATLNRSLAHSGLRTTPQREVVYQSLLEQRDHPTAEEVFARVKMRLPSISLATVYNCLEALMQCRLVKPVNYERESTRYCPNLREHAHFFDVQTGRVFDVDLPESLFRQLREALPAGYATNRVEVNFRGHSPTPPT